MLEKLNSLRGRAIKVIQIANEKKPDSHHDLEQDERINFYSYENMCFEFNALR
jgi:hypothetical protein